MFLLPKFIYITRTIPYLIPAYLLSKLQSVLMKFIWHNSKPRIIKHYLYTHIKLGGLLVPDLTSYNIAATLEPAYILWHLSLSYRWSQLEDDSILIYSIKDVMAASIFHPPASKFSLLSVTQFFWNMEQICYLQKLAVYSQGCGSTNGSSNLDSTPPTFLLHPKRNNYPWSTIFWTYPFDFLRHYHYFLPSQHLFVSISANTSCFTYTLLATKSPKSSLFFQNLLGPSGLRIGMSVIY